jgi:hypothetical protein
MVAAPRRAVLGANDEHIRMDLCKERATTQCPVRRASTGPGRFPALWSGLARFMRDIGCARRLVINRPGSCHFGNYFWLSLYPLPCSAVYATLVYMSKYLKLLPVLLVGLLMAGCNGTITNLTPPQEFRNANGLYSVEAALNSSQQSLNWDSIRGSVIVGNDTYPMRNTQLMTNRWETLIPASEGNNLIYYRFKFEYNYNAFGAPPQPDSKLSPIYRLKILNQ